MTGLLERKAVVITGGARGQGRAHALLSAQEGPDVVVIDIARQLKTVPYPMARPEDLRDTAAEVEVLGRRVLSRRLSADCSASAQIPSAGTTTAGRATLGDRLTTMWTTERSPSRQALAATDDVENDFCDLTGH